MITNDGKTLIKRYLAGWTPAIAASIAFGIGNRAETVTDTALQFEVGRSTISLVSYDFTTDKLIFKAPVPDDVAGSIWEVGLFSQETDTLAGMNGSRLISTFDSDDEDWINPSTGVSSTFTTALARIGTDMLTLSPATSSSQTAQLNEVELDLSGDSAADTFNLAYNVGSNVASVILRFKTDASNYYQFTITAPSTGYKFSSLPKGNATVVGTPSWASISTIELVATATSAGAGSVSIDGLRIEDTDTLNPDYVMISRELLGAAFIKTVGMDQEVEFSLSVAV